MIQRPLRKEDTIPFFAALGYWSPNFYLPVRFVCKRERTLIIPVLQEAHCCCVRLARRHGQLWEPRCICESCHSGVRAEMPMMPMKVTTEIRKAIYSIFPKKENKNHDLKVERHFKSNCEEEKCLKDHVPVCKNDGQITDKWGSVWGIALIFSHTFRNLCFSHSA